MKRILLATVFSLSLMTATFAQSSFHAGLQGSFNSVWILNQDNYGLSELDYDLKFGALVGVEAGYNFDENMGVQIEFNYAGMGQNYSSKVHDFSFTGHKIDTKREVELSYFQIPVLFRYTSGGDKIRFHALIGPQFGFLLSADQHYSADINETGTLVDIPTATAPEALVAPFAAEPGPEDMKNYFQKSDFGLHLDLGVDIFFTENLFLTAALKSYYGFSDINSDPTRNLDPAGYGASKNAYTGLNIGIHYMMEL